MLKSMPAYNALMDIVGLTQAEVWRTHLNLFKGIATLSWKQT